MKTFKPWNGANWLVEINQDGLYKGKYPTCYVWKKQPDNRWKVVFKRDGHYLGVLDGEWISCEGQVNDFPYSFYESALFLYPTEEDVFLIGL